MSPARGIPAMSDQDAGEYDLADVPEEPRPRRSRQPRRRSPCPGSGRPSPRRTRSRREGKRPKAKKDEPPVAEVKRPVRRRRLEAARAGRRRRMARVLPAARAPRRRCSSRKPRRSTPMRPASVAGCRGRPDRELLPDLRLHLLSALHLRPRSRSRPTGDEPPPAGRRARAEARPRRRGPEHVQAAPTRHAKAGRTEQAIDLLRPSTKSYKGTKTAAEAKEALERPEQNLPLFLDRPAVKAEPPPPPSRPRRPRRRGGQRRAQAGQGQCHPDPAGEPGRADADPALAAGHGRHARHGHQRLPRPSRPLPAGFTASPRPASTARAGPW